MYYKVLLVDDEAIVCDGLTKFVNWHELGYEVVGAANSVAQALVFMEHHPVDIVISDIKMPVQTGLQLLEVIQVEYPDVFTIILSGYGEFEFAQKALRLGAVDFLTKPVNFGELKRLLATIYHKMETERTESSYKQDYNQMKLNNLLNNIAKGYITDVTSENIQRTLFSMSDEENYYLIRIHLNDGYDHYDTLTTVKDKIHHMVGEAAEHIGIVHVFNNELNEISCLFMPLTGLRAIQHFTDAIQALLTQSGIDTFIGISSRHVGIIEVKESYIEAGKALQHAIIHDTQKLSMYSDIEDSQLNNYSLDEKIVMDMLQMVAIPLQREKLITIIHSAIDNMDHSSGQSISEIHSFCIQTMYMLNQHVHSLSSVTSDFQDTLYSSIRLLLMTTHANNIKDHMANYLTRLNDELIRLENNAGSGSMIENIKRYIHEHFAEDISLNMLSNVFFIHPIYLSRLFKEKTGVNYIDYVTEIRMTKAKAFLKDPSLKIYDICQLVGYDSPRYFSKLFKSATGMTPKDYKNDSVM
ncbi:response regulator [Paenibacillus sp. CMAA1364]